MSSTSFDTQACDMAALTPARTRYCDQKAFKKQVKLKASNEIQDSHIINKGIKATIAFQP